MSPAVKDQHQSERGPLPLVFVSTHVHILSLQQHARHDKQQRYNA